ncbi:hypothetical protein BESB_067040 [Besnoitia besnoiti]|uniref:Uncharacterized protein n=1 Tax=Besnoitia besnoiti TaxID=94643 RepID=A0A2A9MEG9_BESBE|nr:hypothetical protein BESB_067040 [Besnoitia besnoiti]PFH34671.1 hypothetical protein BESB_067040 [Besnoitia besnoiti]
MVRLRLIPSVVPSVYFIAAFLSCWRGGEILRARGIPGHNPGRIANDEPFLQGLSATDTYFASHEPSPRFSGFEAEGGGLLDVVNPAFWDAAKYLKLAEVPVEGNTALLDDEETLNDSDKMIQVEATPSVDYLTVEEVIPGSVSSNHSTTAPEVGNEHAISLRARKDGTEVEDASSAPLSALCSLAEVTVTYRDNEAHLLMFSAVITS